MPVAVRQTDTMHTRLDTRFGKRRSRVAQIGDLQPRHSTEEHEQAPVLPGQIPFGGDGKGAKNS